MDTLPNPEIDDLALDFVENRLGRYHFQQNWARLKRARGALSSVEKWLLEKGLDTGLAFSIVCVIDDLSKRRFKWTT